MTARMWAVIAVLVVAAAVVVGVVVLSEGRDEGGGNWSIEDAREFDEFTLFWLGEEHQGLPLTDIIYAQGENVVIFIYGTCKPSSDSGCAPPLSLRIEPCTQSPPGRYASLPGAETAFEVRGAEAQFAGHLRLWTRDVTLTIFAERGSAEKAVAALRTVAEGAEGVATPLGPATYPC